METSGPPEGRSAWASNDEPCFYCLGDRPSVHGCLEDCVVLYIAEKAKTFEEALNEFQQYEQETGERMRLNVIVQCVRAQYYERFGVRVDVPPINC